MACPDRRWPRRHPRPPHGGRWPAALALAAFTALALLGSPASAATF